MSSAAEGVPGPAPPLRHRPSVQAVPLLPPLPIDRPGRAHEGVCQPTQRRLRAPSFVSVGLAVSPDGVAGVRHHGAPRPRPLGRVARAPAPARHRPRGEANTHHTHTYTHALSSPCSSLRLFSPTRAGAVQHGLAGRPAAPAPRPVRRPARAVGDGRAVAVPIVLPRWRLTLISVAIASITTAYTSSFPAQAWLRVASSTNPGSGAVSSPPNLWYGPIPSPFLPFFTLTASCVPH